MSKVQDVWFKPLVEATAGAGGALFSTVALAPLDVIKTRIQAASAGGKSSGIVETALQILKEEGALGLYKGLDVKSVESVIKNFSYFFWYQLLKSAAEKKSKDGKLSTLINLLLGIIAGIINISLTLPLDTLSTRLQISREKLSASRAISDVWKEGGFFGFYKGYAASLVLTANPAIQNTTFDKLKASLQLHLQTSNNLAKLPSLTASQSFMLGALSKAIATVVTYPYIRAKVLMQASKSSSTGPKTLSQVFAHVMKQEGTAGLFKGLEAQLLKTVIAAALLYMAKERISKSAAVLVASLRGHGKRQ